MEKVKKYKKINLTLIFLLLLLAGIYVLEDNGGNLIAKVIAEGGKITRLDLTRVDGEITGWYGVYGNLTPEGTLNYSFSNYSVITLDLKWNSSESDLIYILASNETEITTTTIEKITPAEVDSLLWNSVFDIKSATNTFKDLINISTANGNIEVYYTKTNSKEGTYIVAPILADGKLVFLTIYENGKCFSNKNCEYQFILPEFPFNPQYNFKIVTKDNFNNYKTPGTDTTTPPSQIVPMTISKEECSGRIVGGICFDSDGQRKRIVIYEGKDLPINESEIETGFVDEKSFPVQKSNTILNNVVEYLRITIKIVLHPFTLIMLIILYLILVTHNLRDKNKIIIERHNKKHEERMNRRT